LRTEAETGSTQARFRAAKLAGEQAVLGLPRWKFYLLIILSVVVGGVIEKLCVSRYSVPEFEAFLLSMVGVVLFGLLAGVVIRRVSRREIP